MRNACTKWFGGFWIVYLIYISGVFLMMLSFFQQNIAVTTVLTVALNAAIYLSVANLNVRRCHSCVTGDRPCFWLGLLSR